ncbi:hypothetical protein OUZ56_003570 [Daphnia magna]|uniref:Uncharacterized protein n=1 Tax=Daphnia magna TaxID=35525 RepID=A0ABR0A949_9CRUS|nr:hypothetical protein OUZ56_003570 [Daphnia magna]
MLYFTAKINKQGKRNWRADTLISVLQLYVSPAPGLPAVALNRAKGFQSYNPVNTKPVLSLLSLNSTLIIFKRGRSHTT